MAIVPVRSTNFVFVLLRDGRFRLELDYATSPCTPEGGRSVEGQKRAPIASRNVIDSFGAQLLKRLPAADSSGSGAVTAKILDTTLATTA